MNNTYTLLKMESKTSDIPMNKYPRPSLKRDSYICLNGKWDDGVMVPYPLESANSGFNGPVPNEYTYRRTISIPKDFIKNKVILHFGAVDNECIVYIDNKEVGRHLGGYLPFSFDITNAVNPGKEHELSVKVTDNLDPVYPYGKQRKKRGGMWYTPVTGIWKTVWIESVPQKYIEHIEITPRLDSISVNIYSEAPSYHVDISFKGEPVFSGDYDIPTFLIKIPKPRLWTPDTPNLYDMVITTDTDKVSTYFGLRTISVKEIDGKSRITLNGEPFFFHGVLDQGYFPEGLFTPNCEEDYEEDIKRLKELGFNTIRKHIKIEPECFYEACDRLGMLVFQDMVNNGNYHYIKETVLPTIGFKKWDDRKHRVSEEMQVVFEAHMEGILAELYNFPCIVYYTIFNEGWGQFDSDIMYSIVKAMDQTRIIDSTSGWFWGKWSDVDSHHVYFHSFDMKPSDRPIVLSEFGGFSLKIQDHVFNTKKSYGYGAANSISELTDRIINTYNTDVVCHIKDGLCGSIYTQITDVEDEINGLFTYDRKICKVDKERMLQLAEKLQIKEAQNGTES